MRNIDKKEESKTEFFGFLLAAGLVLCYNFNISAAGGGMAVAFAAAIPGA